MSHRCETLPRDFVCRAKPGWLAATKPDALIVFGWRAASNVVVVPLAPTRWTTTATARSTSTRSATLKLGLTHNVHPVATVALARIRNARWK